MAAYTAIDDPEAYFQTVLYTANQTADTTITLPGDTNMQPDLVWIKNRENSVKGHRLFDSIRGVTKLLTSNNDGIEDTATETLTAFTSDGFTLGDDVDGSTYYGVNWETGDGMVAWCWKAGGSTASNTTGDITTTVSVDTTAKFSIFTYTGTNVSGDTIGHSIGSVPHFWIIKRRSATADWAVYHHKNTAAPETDYLLLSTTGATVDSTWWADTAPTSTLITLGNPAQVNQGSSDTFVGYAWSEVQGFSKFGSYEGNNNADGTFVYTGFRPALVVVKAIDTTGPWLVVDNKRIESGSNFDNAVIFWNETTAEQTTNENYSLDLLSNGFKLRSADDWSNDPETYIYAAFAEAPFVNSNGVPCNAR